MEEYLQCSLPNEEYLQCSIPNEEYLQCSLPNEEYLQCSLPNEEYLQCSLPNEENCAVDELALHESSPKKPNRLQTIKHSPLARQILQESFRRNMNHTKHTVAEELKSSTVDSLFKDSDANLNTYRIIEDVPVSSYKTGFGGIIDRETRRHRKPSSCLACEEAFLGQFNETQFVQNDEHDNKNISNTRKKIKYDRKETEFCVTNACADDQSKIILPNNGFHDNSSNDDTCEVNKKWWITKSTAALLLMQGFSLIFFTLYVK